MKMQCSACVSSQPMLLQTAVPCNSPLRAPRRCCTRPLCITVSPCVFTEGATDRIHRTDPNMKTSEGRKVNMPCDALGLDGQRPDRPDPSDRSEGKNLEGTDGEHALVPFCVPSRCDTRLLCNTVFPCVFPEGTAAGCCTCRPTRSTEPTRS